MSVQQHSLDQVRLLLVARRSDLATRRRRVEHDLRRDNEPLVADSDDQAIQLQNDETLEAIGAAASDEMAAIDAALERLQLGLYGICEACGAEIEPARLQAVPHALTCAGCTNK